MAEQTPSSNGDSSHLLRKRTHLEKQSGNGELTPGQRSLPPKRGLLKRSKAAAAPTGSDTSRRVMRTPITRDQVGGPPPSPGATSSILKPPPSPSLQSPPPSPSQKRPAPSSARPVVNRERAGAPSNARLRQSNDRLEKRAIEAERRRKADIEKKRQQEEIAAAKQAEKERKAELREQALKKAEEQRALKQKELERRKAEAERIRLEKEIEAKRLEEERIKREREEELKRLEEEKILQEKERQRIFKNIETCSGSLNEKEQQLAKTIADEMIKRKINWKGYISLHSGIGGAMLS